MPPRWAGMVVDTAPAFCLEHLKWLRKNGIPALPYFLWYSDSLLTPAWEGHYPEDELMQMKRQHVALIPTLMERTTVVSDPAVARRFVQAGVASHGMERYLGVADRESRRLLQSNEEGPCGKRHGCGFWSCWMQIRPADAKNFAKVRYTIRGGNPNYSQR